MPEPRLEICRQILTPLRRAPLVDLGAGHCKFSRIAYELGFPVTSVDARTERVPEDIGWPFIRADVRTVDLRPWPIILCLGLFYHLELNDQIELLKRANHENLAALIVDTHTAPKSSADVVNRFGFGRYEGHLYTEKQDDPRSSFGNDYSFWHTEGSLERIFADYGFQAEKVEPEHALGRAFWRLHRK